MSFPPAIRAAVVFGAAMFCTTPLRAQSPAAAPSAPQPFLYAVEFKTGSSWDAAKPPGEQAHFRDHSANLKKLRDQGSLVLGARYSDKGLIVLQAASEDEAHAMIRQDPSVQARVFAYELHPFNVFYGGTVAPRPRN
jgi:uncharacterized protein YciI